MKLKNIRFKILTAVLAALLLLSACAPDRIEGGPLVIPPDPPPAPPRFEQTDISLIENGASGYKIVMGKDAQRYERHAAAELKQFITEASGVELPVITDEGVTFDSGSKYLVLGETTLNEEAGFTVPAAELGNAGFKIQRLNSTVFMCGGGEYGTLYAAYEFLHYHLGFEVYYTNEISLQRGVTELKLLDINMTDKPDFAYRQGMGGVLYTNPLLAHRMRFNVFSQVFVRDSVQPWHNTLRVLPPNEESADRDEDGNPYLNETGNPMTNYERHPKWFLNGTFGSDAKNELHLTAHGDAEELLALQDTLFEKYKGFIQASFDEGKYYELIAFMHNDEGAWASDESVNGFKETYGDSYAAAMLVQFLNPLADRIKEYMEEEHNGMPMQIVTFAYHATRAAPVVKNGDTYAAIDSSVVPRDNITIFYPPVGANFLVPLTDKENLLYYESLLGWRALTDNISFWTYSTYFKNGLMFYDSFNSMQENLQLMASGTPHYIFDESNNNDGNVAFTALKFYLNSKLQWDVYADMNTLTQNFFDNYYKEASDTMLKLFNELRLYSQYQREELGLGGNVIYTTDSHVRKYWPRQVLEKFNGYIEQAYRDIEPLKTIDPAKYGLLYDRICGEGMTFRYLMFTNYKTAFEDIDATIQIWKEDAARLNFTRMPDIA